MRELEPPAVRDHAQPGGTRGDGDGWSVGADGRRRWGRHGAAGLLLRAPSPAGEPLVLLQHRAPWSHHGGTWGLPGGARDSHESPVQAALREAAEEAGVVAAEVAVRAELVTASTAHGWSYTTVVADAVEPLALTANAESSELRWVPEAEVAALLLHPSFGESWPGLRAAPVRLLVDTANVLGSRPDGWWRDRAGATARLLEELAGARHTTLALPDGTFGWVRELVAVLEGAARSAVRPASGVAVSAAPGPGDDEVVRLAVEDVADRRTVVVTADRGLRARLPDHVPATGPRSVLDRGRG